MAADPGGSEAGALEADSIDVDFGAGMKLADALKPLDEGRTTMLRKVRKVRRGKEIT